MLSPDTMLQGRYRVVRQLGQGGMGAVYESVDERLDTIVALKETLFADEKLRKQFEREARLLARLHHPALPRVSDHFNESDGQFLVMQYIPGEDLSEMLARQNGPFPQEEVLRWADQLCDALDYLHTQDPQIIHRDIKPQNLKLTARGQMVLLDFGLAKGSAGQMSVVTTSASIFGYTPNYAPLEQVQGLGTDARCDIYSLAATLYHLITNVKPPDAISRAGAIVNGQPDPLSPANKIAPQVSGAVSAVLGKGMSQKRDERYPSAESMREALRIAGTSQPELGDAGTVFASNSGANAVASEQSTRLIGERTRSIGSEAQTVLVADATKVRGVASKAEAVTVVRSEAPARGSRLWLAAALLLVLIVGGAGGFYAYRARHREAVQSVVVPAQQNSTQSAQPDAVPAPSTGNQEQATAPKSTEPKNEKAKAETASQRSGATKQSAVKGAESSGSDKPQSGDRQTAAHDVGRNQDRSRNSNVTPTAEASPNDPARNQAGRGHPPGAGAGGTRVRTFPNGMKVVIQPDGTRIVTMPNGTTRVIPPGEKPNRNRNRIP